MKMEVSAYLLLLASLMVASVWAISDPDSDLVGELLALQSRSKSGVIHINDQFIDRFLASSKPPRPYHLLIFFDALHLHHNSDLQLKQSLSEFNLLAASFIANNAGTSSSSGDNLFFCYIEFKESQSSFAHFGVETLPNIRLVAPHVTNFKDSEVMGQTDASPPAESMADFVRSATRFTVGQIRRPPILSKPQVSLIVVVGLASAPIVARKVWAGDTVLHDAKIWLAGAVFVYFFSVSGAMHNIIRKMPMVMADRGKMVYFYQGSGMQLGAEGFAIGFLYTIVGVMLALVTHFLVRLRNVTAQIGVMVFMLLVSFWAVRKVVILDNWKTGYQIHAFWPSRWR